MWTVNLILIIMGTIAGVMGVSFLFRNRKSNGNIRLYVCSCGVFSALWCFSYGIIGMTIDLDICDYVRKLGCYSINAFLVTEVFLVSEMSAAKKIYVKIAKIFCLIISVADFFIYSQNGVDLFKRMEGYTTWTANSEFTVNRKIHGVYILIIFLVLIYFGITWIISNKVKRLRHFLVLLFVSNFILLFFTVPDTYLPSRGYNAISTSGIGAAACAIVMWYGATQLSSFDIRMGNIKENIFDFIETGIIVFDLNQKAAIVNEYVRNQGDYDIKKMQELDDFFYVEKSRVKEIFKKSLDNIYNIKLWDKTETTAYSVQINAVNDNYMEPFCYICVFSDITKEVNAISKYEIASEAKSVFLAQMSHEIRTPINVVLGMNEMILREADDDDIKEYATNIDSAGNTLLTIINSILDFSKIEDGKMSLVPVKYDTASFIHDLVNSIAQRADDKGLRLEVDVDEMLPCTMIGDNVRVSQVIMNLLTNAVKYTEKGFIRFSIQTLEINANIIKFHVSVKDSGIGIKEEDTVKLFESFERLDEIRNHDIEGTGLGISIIKNLLDMMGSFLKVESKYGVGSEFSFDLEQIIDDPTPIGNLEERLKMRHKNIVKDDLIMVPYAKLLVVDDNEMNLRVVKNMLKLYGIKPDLASSGKEAIQYMKEKNYDIVLLDHMMPEMDGIEILKILKKDNLIPKNTYVIALTANAVVGAREFYLKEGFSDYMSKPINLRHLTECLKNYLPEQAYAEDTNKQAYAEDTNEGVSEIFVDNGDAGNTLQEKNREVPAETDDDVMEFLPENEKESEEIIEISPGESEEIVVISSDDNDETNEFSKEEGRNIMDLSSVSSDEITYKLKHLEAEGFDVESGIEYCVRDRDIYCEMLQEYAKSSIEKINNLTKFYEEKNWHNYEVLVHALKSNSKMIGAVMAAKKAEIMEMAANTGDIAYIEKNHENLVNLIHETVKIISLQM